MNEAVTEALCILAAVAYQAEDAALVTRRLIMGLPAEAYDAALLGSIAALQDAAAEVGDKARAELAQQATARAGERWAA